MKLGYADMTDYLAERALGPAGAVCSGIVYEEGPDPDTLSSLQENLTKHTKTGMSHLALKHSL
ncbi:MAG: hypothetical protein R2883_00315 [Caldisericia bacterium]